MIAERCPHPPAFAHVVSGTHETIWVESVQRRAVFAEDFFLVHGAFIGQHHSDALWNCDFSHKFVLDGPVLIQVYTHVNWSGWQASHRLTNHSIQKWQIHERVLVWYT